MKRIISKLDIKGPNLVKGINLEGLRVLGEPSYFAKKYYENLSDEIIYHDCVASLYERKSFLDLIEKTSYDIFIPISVGGGIKSLKDIEKVLSAGADKVFINSAAIKKPKFLVDASKKFGSANICLSIEVIKDSNDEYICLSNYGREVSNKKLLPWIIEAQQLGVGEIILTSVSCDGIGNGFDQEILELIYDEIKVPFIIHGGAGNEKQIYDVLKYEKVSGVAISSLLHYSLIRDKNFKFESKGEGNTQFLKNYRDNTNFKKTSISSIKKYLKKKGISVRL
ncbi:imidazole glycerol phosphate synthase subunit HisF [Candidatus Pelagibacter sp. HIMB1321]|uniref:imidazole glycerol phosphate synthase subunit HisF n=1 Tax=Candidatus Pelagibacter sp. HIMB1321 TaxID=1388755 RepID=UPI000A080323|nr:imidazole glycerol phosphate synthase cyclase subunit [Candidatus Pelagibacter sp. HIMB1321]SMF79598.1 cyclase [Candidatus Pelagibacter sp. HIMB1321]